MLKRIVWNRTVYTYKMDLAIIAYNVWCAIKPKPSQTKCTDYKCYYRHLNVAALFLFSCFSFCFLLFSLLDPPNKKKITKWQIYFWWIVWTSESQRISWVSSFRADFSYYLRLVQFHLGLFPGQIWKTVNKQKRRRKNYNTGTFSV